MKLVDSRFYSVVMKVVVIMGLSVLGLLSFFSMCVREMIVLMMLIVGVKLLRVM